MKIWNKRREYIALPLTEKDILDNPFDLFSQWYKAIANIHLHDANAFVLSTADKNGIPDSRIVLLKDFSEAGYSFFTHYNSSKGKQLAENPFASMLFYWPQHERQIRIQGRVEKLSQELSAQYFKSRPLESQYSALISEQSSVIESREKLLQDYEKSKIENPNPKLPPHWGGYKITPNHYEFWQGQPNRLHDRICFTQENGSWKRQRLAP